MTGVDFSLLIGLLICAGISIGNRRGLIWLLAIAISYIGATIAWRMQIPKAEVFTAAGDVAVCLAIYFMGKYQWELWLWRLYQASVAVSVLYLAGSIGVISRIDHGLYSIILEAINWGALLLIGGTSALQGVGVSHVRVHRPWDRVRRIVLSLYGERKTDSFLKPRRP
jgi:hypothetical protein